MGFRRIEMYEYREIIYRLQKGESARTIAKAGFASRTKIREISKIAEMRDWLKTESKLPDDQALALVSSISSII